MRFNVNPPNTSNLRPPKPGGSGARDQDDRTVLYRLDWCDDWVVLEGTNPEFLHSLHWTKKGALMEMRRMKALARLPRNRRSGKVTMHYRITQMTVLP